MCCSGGGGDGGEVGDVGGCVVRNGGLVAVEGFDASLTVNTVLSRTYGLGKGE